MNSTALTVGNLLPEDDYMHPLSEHPQHNESMFFNFFDTRQGLGGFVRIGNRANEQHAEMTLCVFLPGGDVLMQWGKPRIDSNERFDAAGMKMRVIEPGRRLGVSFAGKAVRIRNPDDMREPGKAMRNNPAFDCRLELEASGTGPMIGDREGSVDAVIFLEGVGHYQQPMSYRGELVVGNDRWELNALGVRDHSWGPRIWHSIYRDRSLWLTSGPQLTVIACKTWLDSAKPPDEMGCVIENGRVTRLRSITMRSHFRPGTYYHDEVRLDVVDVDGRPMSFDGKVLTYVPLRHRREGQETVYLGQAMTSFTFGKQTILGLSEYFDAASATEALVRTADRGDYLME
ncbi:MAG TPA: hypothetical protein VMT29_10770 [Steroidobacteraceae bacterium]|nr:hypothetical protein [Steroidobacteraceae bacterium]